MSGRTERAVRDTAMLTRRIDDADPLHAARRPAARDRGRDPDPGPHGHPRCRHPARVAAPGRRGPACDARHRRAACDRLRQRRPDRRRAGGARVRPSRPSTTSRAENAIAIAADQQIAFEDRVSTIDTTFAADLSRRGSSSLLQIAVPDLPRPRERRSPGSTRPAGRPFGPRLRASSTRPCGPSCATPRSPRRAPACRGGWPAGSTRPSGCSRPS